MAKARLNRRNFILVGTGALAASALLYPLQFLKSSGRKRLSSELPRPNVLFITVDDVGWKDLSCYGNSNIQTPYLDRLAHEGIRFEHAFGVSSSCSSSRASFITGQYIRTHGVDGLVHRHLRRQLKPLRRTMPRYFQEAGYHTAIEGKWHVSLLPPSFYGYTQSLGSALIWKRHIRDTKKMSRYFNERVQDKRPFYLELNFTDTHRDAKGRFTPENEFKVDPASIEVPEWMGLPDWPEIRANLALYYAKLMRTDALIGETLSELRRFGLEQNTIVVFVSDNGSPFPGNKMTLYDRGVGTPLIIRWPAAIPAQKESRALVSVIDIMPTLLELCRLQGREEIQGRSFSGLLRATTSETHREHIFAEMNYHVDHIPMRAVRTDKLKAIENLNASPIGLGDAAKEEWAQRLGQEKDQPWLKARPAFELYDLEKDPHEKQNLAGLPEYAQVENELRRRLREWRAV